MKQEQSDLPETPEGLWCWHDEFTASYTEDILKQHAVYEYQCNHCPAKLRDAVSLRLQRHLGERHLKVMDAARLRNWRAETDHAIDMTSRGLVPTKGAYSKQCGFVWRIEDLEPGRVIVAVTEGPYKMFLLLLGDGSRKRFAAPSTLDLSMCEWWDGTPCADRGPRLKRALLVAELEQDLKRAMNRGYTP